MLKFITQAYLQSDIFGKFVFLFLMVLSILSITLIIYKVWINYWVNKLSSDIGSYYKKKKQSPLNVDFSSFISPYNTPNPFREIYQKVKGQTLEILKKNKMYSKKNVGQVFLSSMDMEQIDAQASSAIYNEKKKLERYLFVLSTIASLSTLLGLLGTVWGISMTFSELPNGSNIMSNDAVLSGLAMALGTTVIGIVVAIPALVAYNYLKHVVEEFSSKMDEFSSDVLSSIEIQYRSVD